jgi:hypothetical protein
MALPPLAQGPEEEIIVLDPAKESGFRRGVVMIMLVAGVGGTAVGLFALVYGVFFWPKTALLPSIAPIVLGSVVLGGTVWGVLVIRRTIRRRLTSFRLSTKGVQGTTMGGSPLRAEWSDPDFALNVTLASGPATWAQNFHSLRWVQFSGAYAREITKDGFQHLLESAKLHGMTVDEKRTESGRFVLTDWRIRPAGRRQ